MSVFPRLCVAWFAAGVLTAFPEERLEVGLVCVVPKLLPVVP